MHRYKLSITMVIYLFAFSVAHLREVVGASAPVDSGVGWQDAVSCG